MVPAELQEKDSNALAAASGIPVGQEQQERLYFAMVCASNMNRSMEAHAMLQQHNFQVGDP